MRPNRFALGAASGRPNSRMISAKTGCALMRTATVSSPAVTRSGMISFRGKTNVSGPGQNCADQFFQQCARLIVLISATCSSQLTPGK